MNVLQCCISLLFVSHAAHSFCEDNCVDRLCSQCKVGYLEPDCCDCQFDYFRVGNQTCCSAEVSIYSSNRVCNDRCEEDGSVTCLRCNTDYEEPFCCECRHNTRQSSSGACIIQHFLPYDVTNGDQILPSEDDGSFGLMKISVPLNFFNTFQTHLYVSTNGLISFINEFSSYIPEPLSNFFPFPIIAPLWMDLNPVDAGLVYYRTTMNASILERVVEMITDINSNYSDYRPSLAVIVTWDDVPLISNHFKRVSFQVVLSTDGKTSFAALLYSQFTVDLISSPCNRLPFLIGFTAGDGRRFTNIPNVLNKINVFRIDGECITSVLPSDVCPLRSMNFECGSPLKASSCVCDERFQSPLCTELFTFGESRGDSVGPHAVDESFQISLPLPVVFFQKKETTLHVSTNGVLSFQSKLMNSFNPLSFPSSDVPLIAPFWADFDFREIGTIFYRVSQDEMILDRLSHLIIERNPNFSSYYPTLCVIITWSSATLTSLTFNEITETFQVVLATDGETSFAVLIYDDPSGIMSIILSNINGIIGFDAGDQFRSAIIISRRNRNNSILNNTNIFRIDGNCITDISAENICALNSTSLECDGLTALSCLCAKSALNVEKCRLTEFIPFGIVNGDSVVPRAVDGASDLISLDVPIVFFLKNQTNLFVSTNGLVSFEKMFTSHLVTSFPRTLPPYVPIIAPFWADFSFRKVGSIYYRTIRDNSTLKYLDDLIADYTIDGFSSTLAFIVTWFQGQTFRFDFVIDLQMVILTDGAVSYAVFVYGSIMGSIMDTQFKPIVGFDAGDGKNGLSMLGTSIFSNITGIVDIAILFRIDGNCMVVKENDICGSNSVPIRCDNNEAATKCLCNVGIRSTENNTCLEFLQFGGRAGDDIVPLPSEPMVTTKNISLSTPLVYYRKSVSSLHVSTDGLITLGREALSNSSTTLPSLIVPLYVQRDVTSRSTDKRTLYYRVTYSTEEVVTIITDFNSNLTNFRPSLALVTTWLFDDDEISLKTYVQSILCTDGITSFAIFLYEDPSVIYNEAYQVGFDAGNMTRRISLPETNYTFEMRTVFRIDGECITIASPGKMCGLNSVTLMCDSSLTATKCMCHSGYEHEDELNCKDIDECEVGSHNCTQICNNTEGGYICTCRDGYQIDSSDNRTCIVLEEEVQRGSDVEPEVVVPTSLIVLLFLVIIIVVVLCCVKRKKKSNKEFLQERSGENQYLEHRLRNITVQSSFKHNLPKSLLINSCNLDLGKTIGQGEFGIVYKSKLKKHYLDKISDTVAVKTLKGFIQREIVKDLLKECVKMSEFDHPNVLKLIGVCLDGGPAPYIIMPFMENGSLLAYLKENRESLLFEPGSSNPDDVGTVQKELMDMCIQVAKGMEYLASKRVVHRDLAARNCMIDVNFVIKVADFGLSESIDTTKEYFRQDQDVIIKLPLKWLALESINDGVFSEKSDVWSFGVTCWEIFSGGKTPYPGINPVDLPHQLDTGFRMEKPLNAACSDNMYSIIKNCWKSQAELRPSFSELVTDLSSQLLVMADYMDFSSEPDVVIVNVDIA